MSGVDRTLRTLARELDGQPASLHSVIVAIVVAILKPRTVADRLRRAKRALTALNAEDASEQAIRRPGRASS